MFGAEVASTSMRTSSVPDDSSGGCFASAKISEVGVPMAGEAIRDAAVPGSRFVSRAAFRRFSTSSLAARSCSCIANAEDWSDDQTRKTKEMICLPEVMYAILDE